MTTAPLTVWEDFDIPAHARGGQVTLNLYDHLAAYAPKRPGAYLRISSDRFGLEAGVDRQLEDAEDTRARLHWGSFAKIYKENDTSAFKKRKIIKPDGSVDWMVLRPEFRQLLADLAHGVIDGVIFYDLDRLVRQPRDLEDLIDIVEYVKRPVTVATGGRMNLINDSDRHMARMMCVMALKSSEDTARPSPDSISPLPRTVWLRAVSPTAGSARVRRRANSFRKRPTSLPASSRTSCRGNRRTASPRHSMPRGSLPKPHARGHPP
ncbi:recombinase family protein [Streptomyces gilvosporeus]|uniref:recombinase family protein n=1 Tax=Streptomyces gilvosporeus TaxID=553510 RepID=UPI00131EB590|nr:recombinase family protein [Streptomyces gilvosporeus]